MKISRPPENPDTRILLTYAEVMNISVCYPDREHFARAIQLALIEKLSKEPVGHYCLDIAKFEEGTHEYHSKSEWEPLYHLPTPQELEES